MNFKFILYYRIVTRGTYINIIINNSIPSSLAPTPPFKQDYPNIDFSTPPLQMPPHPSALAAMGNGGPSSGTLRRGVRGLVPPPDVTHHTSHHAAAAAAANAAGGVPPGVMLLNVHPHGGHPHHHPAPSPNMTGLNNLSGGGGPKPPPQGILKDPNRKPAHSNIQILNVANVQGMQQASGAGSPAAGLLMAGAAAAFDPSTHNLSSFNASMGYTDADGHLV